MIYNAILSLAVVPFDLVLLFHLKFNHRSTEVYHDRMRFALVCLSASGIVDTVCAFISLQNTVSFTILTYMLAITHLLEFTLFVSCPVSFVQSLAKKNKPDAAADKMTLLQKALFVTAPLLLALLLYVRFLVNPYLITFTCCFSILTYAFYFVTEFPVYDRLRQRLDELSKAVERAREAEQRAAREDRNKNDFLTNMSHEIRTPLNAIHGMAEMILRAERNETIRGYAREIRDEGGNLLSIVGKVLDYYGIEAGSPEPAEVPEEPVEVLEESVLPEDAAEEDTCRFFAPDAAVLIVDDTPSNLRVVEQLLKHTGLKTDTCESGTECLVRLNTKAYDVILLDHMMPGMDGIDTMHAIRARKDIDPGKTKVIVLTANAIVGAREMYLAEGFDDYLSKPVEPAKLEETLMRFLPADKVITPSDPRFADLLAASREKREREEREGNEAARIDMEVLRSVQGIDLEEALRLCSDTSLLRSTMVDFAESIDEESELIESCLAARDFKTYTIKVHALKSVARLIGATALSEDARYLEGVGNTENEAELQAKTPKLLSDYRAYKEYLAPVLPAEAEDESLELISEEDLAEAYESLREFVEAHDFDSADFIMETLAGYRIPPEEKERYDKIRRAVRKIDRTTLLESLL